MMSDQILRWRYLWYWSLSEHGIEAWMFARYPNKPVGIGQAKSCEPKASNAKMAGQTNT